MFGDRDLLSLRGRALRAVRGRDLAMVFQDPLTSLHPMLSVGHQLTEHVRFHEGASRQRGREAGLPAARAGADPGPRRRAARVPAPVLGRDAPAHRDRHGAGLPAEAADRRRADHGPRRDRAGGHPAAARRAAPRDRPVGRAHHPRPRRDVVGGRPGVDLLRRPDRRVGLLRRRHREPAPPVHEGPARRPAAPRGRGRLRASGHPRPAADAARASGRLRVQPALRVRRSSRAAAEVPPLVPIDGDRLLACPPDPLVEP